MSNKIIGKEYPLAKIFSADFEYHIPGYQRPYAWTETEASVLFDDLYDFFQADTEGNYFLGSIVLIKSEGERRAEVIDGQQRLTTLSILFAAMSDRFTGEEYKARCKNYLQEEGNILEGISAQPRVFLRDRDQDFFSKYIQDVRLNNLNDLDPATMDTEAKRHIQANCAVLREKFKEYFNGDDDLLKFSKVFLTRCFFVVVSTPNQESAFRVFSVMNSRGLDLLPIDIIKSKTIGHLPTDQQKAYTDRWEELESLTGRDGFNDVFSHTRMIFAKERPRKTLLEEFTEYVLQETQPAELIDEYIEPYTGAYVQLRDCAYISTKHADEINNLLYWLNKTDNKDWMPTAIKFLTTYKNDSAYILWFIKKLERLASYLYITGQDVNHRVNRYKWILVEMENRPDSSIADPLVNIELTAWEREMFRDTLDGEIYSMTSKRRNYIVQRLDSFVGDGGATYTDVVFTIEHVLPQHPQSGSEWMQLWADEDRKYWLNRIANLVPLTRRHNAAAQNYDFNTKKNKYFKSKNGTSSYALTTQVLHASEWTPEYVQKRQETLAAVFSKHWELDAENAIPLDSNFKLAGRGASATGYPDDNGTFVVLKGSRISSAVTSGLQPSYCAKREELIKEGVIRNRVFIENYTFDSVSAAASVVLGRASNGRTEWTMIDGRTIAHAGH